MTPLDMSTTNAATTNVPPVREGLTSVEADYTYDADIYAWLLA